MINKKHINIFLDAYRDRDWTVEEWNNLTVRNKKEVMNKMFPGSGLRWTLAEMALGFEIYQRIEKLKYEKLKNLMLP